MSILYLAHWNYDYSESLTVYHEDELDKLYADIIENFELEQEDDEEDEDEDDDIFEVFEEPVTRGFAAGVDVDALVENLNSASAIPAFNTPEFWALVTEAYEGGKWKGFKVYKLDTETLKQTEIY